MKCTNQQYSLFPPEFYLPLLRPLKFLWLKRMCRTREKKWKSLLSIFLKSPHSLHLGTQHWNFYARFFGKFLFLREKPSSLDIKDWLGRRGPLSPTFSLWGGSARKKKNVCMSYPECEKGEGGGGGGRGGGTACVEIIKKNRKEEEEERTRNLETSPLSS